MVEAKDDSAQDSVEDNAVASDPGLPDRDAYNSFVSNVSLGSILLDHVAAVRTSGGDAARTTFELNVNYQLADEALLYRFAVHASLLAEDDTEVGTADAGVVVNIQTRTTPDDASIAYFGSTSAAMMAHPFLREAIASTAQRIGFAGVMLPLMVQNPGTAQ